MRKEFEKWAGMHQYLPIVERDFWSVWIAAWEACEQSKAEEIEALNKRIFYLELRVPGPNGDGGRSSWTS